MIFGGFIYPEMTGFYVSCKNGGFGVWVIESCLKTQRILTLLSHLGTLFACVVEDVLSGIKESNSGLM